MKTPVEIIQKFEQAASGLVYGTVTLSLSVKQQGQRRFIISKDESFLYNQSDTTVNEPLTTVMPNTK